MAGLSSSEIIARIDRYLADSRLTPEALLRKRWAWIWFMVTFVFVSVTTFYSLIVLEFWPLWWFGAVFMTGYFIGLPIYRRAKRFDFVINIVFAIYTIAAMFAMLQIGGLNNSMGYIFIGLNCAMGSMLAGNTHWTIGLFALYCTTIVVIGLFQSSLSIPDYITPQKNTISFVGLALWINACILFLVILFMKDKTRQEKAETERLRKIDEAKTKLFTNVSHEFRTPLTVIQGIAEQLEKDGHGRFSKGPRKIQVQSRILLHLVNQMLDISKIETESMQLNLINGDIKKFTQYISGSFTGLAEHKGINLHYTQNKEALFTDYDPEKLMHVLVNLVSNAIKFTSSGGDVNIEVQPVISKNQEVVEIKVKDTGKGIPQDSIEHIFDRFYQVPDNTEQTPGTGLGLAITMELVKLMNGDIRVKSELNKGTEFTVTLPFAQNARTKEDHGISLFNSEGIHSVIPVAETQRSHEIFHLESTEKPLLLIVEDNNDVVEYLESILKKQFVVELAYNGREGLDKAVDIIPDIILSDVMMPKMDGFEMLKCLKEDIRTDHIPVVLLTARGDFQSKLEGLEIGADHYIAKPFNEKELLLKLNNLLEIRKKMQQRLGAFPLKTKHGNSAYKEATLFVSKINLLIDKEIDNEYFGIGEICSSLNMSRAQLYRKFTALTNKPIGRYIRYYRLCKAKLLLEEQGMNVSEAAFETGFKNLSHFSTSFREEFGFSPKELL